MAEFSKLPSVPGAVAETAPTRHNNSNISAASRLKEEEKWEK